MNFKKLSFEILFTPTFIELWKKKKIIFPEFSEVFCQIIIFSADEVISASVKDAWEYLILDLESDDFNREFFKIINYFDSEDKRAKLEHFDRYISLYTLNKYDKDTEEFSKLREKIEISFWEEEYGKYSAFITREVSYLLDIHERAIHENIFIAGSIDILQKYNQDFILDLLKNIESEKIFWGLEKIIAQYIIPNQVEEFINLLRWQENEYVIFDVYLIAKENKRDDILGIFQKSSYYDEIIKIETRRRETQEKYKFKNKKKNFFWC